jgi:uncharacterized protein
MRDDALRVGEYAAMNLFYLHGFASSARSSKAAFLADRLRPRGLTLHCPDFNAPEFSTLTVSRMIDQTRRAIEACPPAPAVLIGSSLGAFVAVHTAVRHPDLPIAKLVLLAPALDFGGNRMRELGEAGIARWRATDRLDVFHYGYGETRSLGYALYEDAAAYDSFAVPLSLPILILQGRRDQSVDPAMVERFAASRPNVALHFLDDDHQLLGSLDMIWTEMERFLAGVGPPP